MSGSPAPNCADYRKATPDIQIIAHPECPPDVLEEADYVGSTSGMIRYVDEARPSRVVLITECSMSDNVAVEFPDVDFVRPCNLCPHRRPSPLPKISRRWRELKYEVEVDPKVGARALGAVARMLEYSA